jgi:hypothetical protein
MVVTAQYTEYKYCSPRGSSCTLGTFMKYHPESAPPAAPAINQPQCVCVASVIV